MFKNKDEENMEVDEKKRLIIEVKDNIKENGLAGREVRKRRIRGNERRIRK